MKKRIIQIVIIVLLLAVLLVPAINPFLDEAGKAAMTAQLQNTFGALFDGAGAMTPTRLLSAVAVVLVLWLLSILLSGLVSGVSKLAKRRSAMAELLGSLIKLVCFVVAVAWALRILGVNMTGIFASLGLVSLVLGFGAQSLIEDAVTGIFIIFEGQYQIGDIIVLDGFRGVVKHIGIRTTVIEDAGGNQKIVNNSDIRNVQNRSRNVSVAVCDLSVSYAADVREVEKVLAEALPQIYEAHRDLFLTAPRYAGVESLGESSVVFRVLVDVAEENFFAGYRTLNRELKIMCDEHGIEIPFNQIVVHQADASK